jgi:hypothetical protein
MTAEPIEREPVQGFGRQTGPLRPDWGDGWAELECDVCQATWTGPIGEPCEYCHLWHQRALETQRQQLLYPDHLQTSAGDPRYDNLSCDESRQVWDATRGQRRGADSIVAWTRRLADAVQAELITPRQAEQAMRRITR